MPTLENHYLEGWVRGVNRLDEGEEEDCSTTPERAVWVKGHGSGWHANAAWWDGVYVTFWGTAWAEVQGSPARGPDIGLNFQETEQRSGGGENKGGRWQGGRGQRKERTEAWKKGGRDEGERTVRRKKIKKAREIWGETQCCSVVTACEKESEQKKECDQERLKLILWTFA